MANSHGMLRDVGISACFGIVELCVVSYVEVYQGSTFQASARPFDIIIYADFAEICQRMVLQSQSLPENSGHCNNASLNKKIGHRFNLAAWKKC